MGRGLVILGLVIAAVGVVVMAGVPLGRLPGDFTVRRGSFTFYFPLATSIVVSILLTLLLQWLRPSSPGAADARPRRERTSGRWGCHRTAATSASPTSSRCSPTSTAP